MSEHFRTPLVRTDLLEDPFPPLDSNDIGVLPERGKIYIFL